MDTILTAVALILCVPVLKTTYQYISWIYRTRFIIGKEVDKLPGDPTRFPFGTLYNGPGFTEKTTPFIKGLSAKYNRLWRMWVGPFVPVVNLCHPDTVKILVKTEEPKFTEGTGGYVPARPWLGDGLLISDGQKWKRNRRLLTPAFHFDILKGYVNVYNEQVEILMDKWLHKCKEEQSVEIQTDICLCTLSTILKCAFSYDEKIQDAGERNPYAAAVMDMSRLIVMRLMQPLYRLSEFIYKLSPNGRTFFKHCDYVHEVSDNVIRQRRKTLRDNPNVLENKKYLDFLDILLQAKDADGTGLTDLEIRNEVDTFLFEGHDTTASGISWVLYSLAKNPEYQKKAQKEIDEILADRTDKSILWEDLSRLPYLTMCLKESMRLWAPVPVIARQLTRPMEIDGVTLAANTNININILALHHNPTVWGDDHDEFKPDRFLHENISKMDAYAFIPFSAGPRNCIGQNFAMNEQKVAVARIIQQFDLSVDDSHPVYPRPEIVTRAIHGIKLFMKPR